jgi:glycosyltransferase involved in cell wall biosynthesis
LSAKPKILQIITLSECGGAQNHLLELIDGLREKYDFEVLVGKEGYLTERLAGSQIAYQVIPSLVRSISLQNDLKATREIFQKIKYFAPALVHCHSSKAGIVGRLAAFLANKPSIFTAHGWAFHPKVSFKQRAIAWLSEIIMSFVSKKIICVSQFDLQLALTDLMPKNKLVVIHNGIGENFKPFESHPLAQQLKGKLSILMVGRFAEPKRQDLLIRAFADFQAAFPAAVLVLAGEGPQKKLCEELVRQLNLNEKVFFTGQVSPVEPLLELSDIFILISEREGLPISILEALRAGLPVVASCVGGINELISPENGCLVENKVTEIASALSYLASNAALRAELKLNNQKRFKKYFKSEIMLQKIDELYGEVIH